MSEQEILDALTAPTGWENCPTDVLMLIFKQLDSKSLISCMAVNYWWRDVVDYVGQHHDLWPDIAQAGMLNKGLTFRNKSSPDMSWRDLYFNSHLWHLVDAAEVSWSHFHEVQDIQSVHVYKDIFIVGHGTEALRMKYYKIPDSFHRLDGTLKVLSTEGPIARAVRNEADNTLDHNNKTDQEESDRMKEKLLKEGPFMKYTIFDDQCFYMLDERSVMRRYLWDNTENKWRDEVLGRYYGCAKSIKDIHVYDGDIYLLLKTGYVMKGDRSGRNFESTSVFDFPPHSLTFFMRLFRSNVLKSIETVFIWDIPEYCTSPSVMFHKFSAVVSVPSDKEFKVTYQRDGDQVVIECPDLSCALEHGEILLLGYNDGRVEVCKPRKLIENGGKPELSGNVRDCPKCIEKDCSIVGLEVYEDKESHYLLVATSSNIYRLAIRYPDHIKDSISAIKKQI